MIKEDLYQILLIRTHEPFAEADRHDDPGLSHEPVPGMAAVIEDGTVGGEDPVGEPVVAQELPEVLDRVEILWGRIAARSQAK